MEIANTIYIYIPSPTRVENEESQTVEVGFSTREELVDVSRIMVNYARLRDASLSTDSPLGTANEERNGSRTCHFSF